MPNSQNDSDSEIIWKVDEEDNLRAYHKANQNKPVIWAPQPGSQAAFLSCPVTEVLYSGTRGPGKMQPLDARVMGEIAWTTMGELKVGQRIKTARGTLSPITHIFEHKNRDIYRVTFDDGSSTEAGDEHLWKYKVTELRRKSLPHNWHVNDTLEMKRLLDHGYAVLIPTVDPVPMRQPPRLKKLPIPPYLLGLWLGDGHSTWAEGKGSGGNRTTSIGFTSHDECMLDVFRDYGFTNTSVYGELRLTRSNDVNGMYLALRKIKAHRAKANGKFVPTCYKQAPIEVRTAVLQGLMDTDGTCSKDGHCSFTSVSEQLAKDVQELAWSLGAKASIHKNPSFLNGVRYQDHYDVSIQPAGKFQPFRLQRKQGRVYPYMHEDLTRRVKSIEYVGKRDARCIRIDDLEHLYITDDYIVTHNTDALLMDFCQHVGQGLKEDWRGILFRRTFPELKDVIAKANKWFPQIFPTARYNKSEHTWSFADGEQLIFGFMEKEEDYWKYHGHGFPWIGWEELTNWPTDVLFKRMFSTNRSSNKNVPRKIRATCNPSGVGHNWTKIRYGLPTLPGQLATKIIKTPGEPDRVAIHGTIHENKILLHADPTYIDTLRASCSSPAEEAAWIEGSWDITSGGMFDDLWDRDIHIIQGITPQIIPRGWHMDRSYDHGQSKPFSVGWWAQSNGEPLILPSGQVVGQVRGDLIRIQEWYGWDGTPDKGLRMTASEIAVGIRERQREMCIDTRVRPGVADGSIFDQWEPGKSIQGDMRKKGVKWLRADKGPGTRVQGWQQIREMLKNAKPKEGHREEPGLFVSDLCTQFLRTFPVLSRDKKNPEDVDTDIEDHIADEVRYRCRAKQAKRTTMFQG